MAFDSTQLVLMSVGGQFQRWRYDTLDTHATVDTLDYFNNLDDDQGIRAGDIMDVIVWTGAVSSTGTISTYGTHIAMTVGSTDPGSVDMSTVTVNVVTNTD